MVFLVNRNIKLKAYITKSNSTIKKWIFKIFDSKIRRVQLVLTVISGSVSQHACLLKSRCLIVIQYNSKHGSIILQTKALIMKWLVDICNYPSMYVKVDLESCENWNSLFIDMKWRGCYWHVKNWMCIFFNFIIIIITITTIIILLNFMCCVL